MKDKPYNVKLTPKDSWKAIQKQIINLENTIFAETGLNEDQEDLRLQFTNPKNINHLALDKSKDIIGYSSIGPLESYIEVPFVEKDLKLNKKNSGYLFSIGVHPDHRRKGIGTALMDSLIKEMKLKGFNRLTGHFLPASQELMLSRGAKTLKHYENWYNSGLPANYMALKI